MFGLIFELVLTDADADPELEVVVALVLVLLMEVVEALAVELAALVVL